MSDAIESLTNRDKALRGEVVVVADVRLREMRKQAIYFEGVVEGSFHWHWAAALNELASLRKAGSAAVPASDFAALEDERDRLRAENERLFKDNRELHALATESTAAAIGTNARNLSLRAALRDVLPYVCEGVIECGGNKCRLANCASCCINAEDAGEKSVEAANRARAALAHKEGT